MSWVETDGKSKTKNTSDKVQYLRGKDIKQRRPSVRLDPVVAAGVALPTKLRQANDFLQKNTFNIIKTSFLN